MRCSMENRIDILNPIDRSRLKGNDYFRTLVNEGAEKGHLSDFDIEKIQTELIEVLHSLCKTVCEKGNSSMKTEDAEEIANSVMYTVSVLLKKSPSPESALERLKKEPVGILFNEGRQEIVSLLTKARGKWAVICKELFETENVYYASTVREGMKAFFQNYNYEIASHKNIITCDYPLCEDKRELDGAEFIYQYLSSFKSENDFLNKFSQEAVHNLLLCIDSDLEKAGLYYEKCAYKNLPVNIFIYVFACALALELAGKDFFTLCLTESDVKIIKDELKGKTYSEAVTFFDKLTESLCSKLYLCEETEAYLKKCAIVLASEVTCIREKALTGIFLVRKSETGITLEADEVRKLSDSEYRFILSQINMCQDNEKKLSLIKENIKNADDFSDIVKDLSLTRADIYLCLSALDMAQCLKLFKRYNVFSYCFSDEDRFMKDVLEGYISSVKEKSKDTIMKMLSLMR